MPMGMADVATVLSKSICRLIQKRHIGRIATPLYPVQATGLLLYSLMYLTG
jgi:hypothetical protein